MILKINGLAAAINPVEGKGPLWGVVESGRDKATEMMMDGLGGVLHNFGIWVLQIAPETLLLLSMIFCLGVIINIPRTGKWTAITLISSIVMDVIKGSVLG
jgi:hypothetical protein